jgi:hypothetical protein
LVKHWHHKLSIVHNPDGDDTLETNECNVFNAHLVQEAVVKVWISDINNPIETLGSLTLPYMQG